MCHAKEFVLHHAQPTFAVPRVLDCDSSTFVLSCDRSLSTPPTAIMGPPLMPTQAGFALIASRPAVQIEMFVDLVCPFSMKMYNTVYNDVLPKLAGKTDLNIVVNQVPQPWHPQGTYVHEAAFAVKAAAPDAYPAYLSAVYKAFESGKFKDDDTIDKSRKQIYAELLDLLATGDDTLKAVDVAAVTKLLTLQGEGNAGTPMTQHIKWACKYHRSRGVHVTPTVHVNGLEAGIVSSGWTGEQWLKFIEPST